MRRVCAGWIAWQLARTTFCSSNAIVWQTYSALVVLRAITKYFIEVDSEQNLYLYFVPQDNATERLSLMSAFVDTLFRTTIILPVQSYSYALHLEVLNTLLSLLSIQMCAKEAVLISAIYSIFMYRLEYVRNSSLRGVFATASSRCSPLLISEFTRTLLEHFMKQVECPAFLAAEAVGPSNGDSGGLYKIGQSVASTSTTRETERWVMDLCCFPIP